MATTSVRPIPATDAAQPEQPRAVRSSQRIEDCVDYAMVRAARSLAARRGEKPVAWSEFKKKLAR
jgi:hypothetical protein